MLSSLIVKPKDFWSGLIFIAFGLAAVILAREYPMGSATKMGPAYFPTVLGGLLTLIGLIAVIRSLLHISSIPHDPIGRFAIKEGLLVLAATVLFGILVRGAGMVVAIALLVGVSAYASNKFRWGSAVAMAVGLTLFCILVFIKALGVPLPILGSWFSG